MAILTTAEGTKERISSPFFHGTPYFGAEVRGLAVGTYLTKDKKFAEEFGEYIYRVKLPRDFPLDGGEDYDQYVAQ